jgi:hypothetical protein
MHQGRKYDFDFGEYGKPRYIFDGLQANRTRMVLKFKLKGMLVGACCLAAIDPHAKGHQSTQFQPRPTHL